jgi:NitT/TauT family transport system substrate-binding protein
MFGTTQITREEFTMKLYLRVAAVLAASALLAACGGGSESDDSATAEEPEVEETEDEAVEEEEPAEEEEAADTSEPVAIEFFPPSGVTIASAAPYSSVPLALGYFEEEGLDVTINEGGGGSVAVLQALDAGQVDISMATTSSLIAAVANGADVTAFYTQITGNNQLPAVAEDSPIQEPLDLEGTTIGVASLESSSVDLIRSMVQQEGGDPDSIDFVAAGAGVEALNFLQAGRIDALGMWDAVYAEIELLGQPLRLVGNDYFSDLGFHMSLVATDADLAERPDVMAGFARALSKGMAFSQANPEAAIQLHWEVYPQAKPAGVDEEEALAQSVRVLAARNDFTQPAEGLWGNSTIGQVEQQLELQAELNGLTGVAASDIWTDALIASANDFDNDLVVGDAESFTP